MSRDHLGDEPEPVKFAMRVVDKHMAPVLSYENCCAWLDLVFDSVDHGLAGPTDEMQHFIMPRVGVLTHISTGRQCLGPEAEVMIELNEMRRNEYVDRTIRWNRLPVALATPGGITAAAP